MHFHYRCKRSNINDYFFFFSLFSFCFFFFIRKVLITKLRSANTVETRQYRKASKALLVLIPLLGITYLVVLAGPNEGVGSYIFVVARAFLLSTQVRQATNAQKPFQISHKKRQKVEKNTLFVYFESSCVVSCQLLCNFDNSLLSFMLCSEKILDICDEKCVFLCFFSPRLLFTFCSNNTRRKPFDTIYCYLLNY